MNKLLLEKRAQIVGLLVEGNSLRATLRLADCSINTITKLLVDVGSACAAYPDKHVRNLAAKQVQCDEIWSFVYTKQGNVKTAKAAPAGVGDIWTWTALEAQSKLIGVLAGRRTRCQLRHRYYNFGRINKSLRVPPAMQAGGSENVWSFEEIAASADQKSN